MTQDLTKITEKLDNLSDQLFDIVDDLESYALSQNSTTSDDDYCNICQGTCEIDAEYESCGDEYCTLCGEC